MSGMLAYVVMAGAAGIGFVWRIKLAHAVAVSVAPVGASFTFLALVTGAVWGKPMWGTYWEWADARLVFELLLLFLFLGLYGAARRVRRPREGGPRQRDTRCSGCDQRAHHPLLGGVVEYFAPGADDRAARLRPPSRSICSCRY